MKFKVTGNELLRKLYFILGTDSKPGIKSKRGCLLFTVDGINRSLKIYSTDGKLHVSAEVQIHDASGKGEVLLPVKELIPFVKNVRRNLIIFETDTSHCHITVSEHKHKINLETLDPINYPRPVTFPMGGVRPVDLQMFRDGLLYVFVRRPKSVSISPDGCEVVKKNFMLRKYWRLDLPEMTLSSKAVRELLRITGLYRRSTNMIKVRRIENNIAFKVGDVLFYTTTKEQSWTENERQKLWEELIGSIRGKENIV